MGWTFTSWGVKMSRNSSGSLGVKRFNSNKENFEESGKKLSPKCPPHHLHKFCIQQQFQLNKWHSTRFEHMLKEIAYWNLKIGFAFNMKSFEHYPACSFMLTIVELGCCVVWPILHIFSKTIR